VAQTDVPIIVVRRARNVWARLEWLDLLGLKEANAEEDVNTELQPARGEIG